MTSHRCAIYTRFSSDRQSPTSITDQIRKCKEYASGQKWKVLEDHIYTDAALTGTNMERDGLKKLLRAATSSQRPFDCILIDDSSRLSRHTADVLKIYETLTFCRIRLVAVSQGVDTESAQGELLVGIHGLIDSVYSRELALKTHRGLEGRALKGLATGGRCFGYRTRGEVGRLEIENDEAVIVRRIFEMYADGHSLKRIARQLNEEGIRSPKAPRRRLKPSWCMSSIRVILRNSRYRGQIVWNKTRKIREPNSGRRIKRSRPQSEWIVTDWPDLRIISDDLWHRVQRRFTTLHDLWGQHSGPGLRGQQRQIYLFSGFLECGECGGSVTLVSGRWRTESQQYGCSIFHQRGEAVCSNRMTVRRAELEFRLLQGLQEKVLQKDSVELIVNELKREMESKIDVVSVNAPALRAKRHEIESEIRRLIGAIAVGEPSESVISAIRERESELRTIDERLSTRQSTPTEIGVAAIRRFALSRLMDLRALLTRPENVTRARALLAEHVGKIKLLAVPTGGYAALGTFDVMGGKGLRVSGAEGQS